MSDQNSSDKSWILGIGTSGSAFAVPVANSMLLLNTSEFKQQTQGHLEELMKRGKALCEMHKVPVPVELTNAFGINPADLPDLPEEMRSSRGKQIGDEVEQLRWSLDADLIIQHNGHTYPMKEPRLATFEEALEARS